MGYNNTKKSRVSKRIYGENPMYMEDDIENSNKGSSRKANSNDDNN